MHSDDDFLDAIVDWDLDFETMLRWWFTTHPDRTPEHAVASALRAVSRVASILEGQAVLHIFPRADGPTTNEWLRFKGHGEDWHIEIGGQPDRHFGEIPDELQDALIFQGWSAIAEVDENFTVTACSDCDIVHPFDFAYDSPPDSPLYQSAIRGVAASTLIHNAPPGGWYLQGSVTMPSEDCECDGVPLCFVDLGQIFADDLFSPVVWPLGSPWARWACELEIHDLHDGPCPDESSDF
ncbi:hypothetical protein LBMAG12_04520 [Actinomycetes bacterium]|nr:hypothetical protein LBMAG12_04520 [Actinomycetes bacterium]